MEMLPSIPEFDRQKTISFFRIVFYLGLIAASAWLLYALRSLIPPFLIAILIALTLSPEIDRMEQQGWRRGIAIIVIYVLFVACFVGIMLLLVPFVSTQLSEIAQHVIPSSFLTPSADKLNDAVLRFLRLHHVPNMLRAPVMSQVGRVPMMLSGYLSSLAELLPVWAGNLVWVILVPILAFYFLADYHKILGKTLIFVRPERRIEVLKLLNDVVAVFGNYIRSLIILMLMDIVVIYAVLRIMHVPYPETIAVISGVLYTIPYLGAIVSTVLIGLVSLQVSVSTALVVLGIMVVIHQIIFDQIVAPRVIGKQVGIHPLWAITAMLIGGEMFGVGGTLMAVPMAAGVQVVLVHLYPKLKQDDAAVISENYAHERHEIVKNGNSKQTINKQANTGLELRSKTKLNQAEQAPLSETGSME